MCVCVILEDGNAPQEGIQTEVPYDDLRGIYLIPIGPLSTSVPFSLGPQVPGIGPERNSCKEVHMTESYLQSAQVQFSKADSTCNDLQFPAAVLQ